MSEAAHALPPRPEIEVVADAVWRLIDAGLVADGLHGGAKAEAIRRACVAVGISLDDLRQASIRADRGYVEPPRGHAASHPSSSTPAAPQLSAVRRVEERHRPAREARATVSERHRKANESKPAWRAANPEPGIRRCARCRESFHVEHFPIKDQASGRRRSYCGPLANDCWRIMQRERYLSVDKLDALGRARLTFVVDELDGVVGLVCIRCRRPIEAGDEVTGVAEAFTHNLCPTDDQGDHQP